MPYTYTFTVMHTVVYAERCPAPTAPENHLELVSADLENEYKKGEVVVWECKDGKGFGHVLVKCKGNGEWSKPSKKCKGINVNI